MKEVPIKLGSLGTVLKLLGTVYRNPADALKEHISNAIDEHLKALPLKTALPECHVKITMKPDQVVIEYGYGMTEAEFKTALQKVAQSSKKDLNVAQIGQLGIGMFSVFQVGKKCVFVSQKSKNSEPVSVTLREGAETAVFESVKKHDRLSSPGIKITISGLRVDPTKDRGPLSKTRLKKVFAEKFDTYLRDNTLKITVCEPKGSYEIEPLKIELPAIGAGYEERFLGGCRDRRVRLKLYYDPSGKGTVAIRHTGVTIVENISEISAYGLEESVFAGGNIKGFIDADFLAPLPARTGFEENEEWMAFLVELDNIRPAIEAEVELLKEAENRKKLSATQKRALELAIEIFNEDEFQDLEIPEIFGRKVREPRFPPNGFDFIPDSIRVDPGKMGSLPLKTAIPLILPDRSTIRFAIDDPSIRIFPKKCIVKKDNADDLGVVTVKVSIIGQVPTDQPATLTAEATLPNGNKIVATAKIRIAESTQTREPPKDRSGVNYVEKPFETGANIHSRCVSKVIEVNTLNPDYIDAAKKSEDEQLAYAALMIGKEVLAFNDRTGETGKMLERMLTFHFRLRKKLK